MEMSDEQRRWWFATHPEFSWSRAGSRLLRRRPGGPEFPENSNTALANERLRQALGYPTAGPNPYDKYAQSRAERELYRQAFEEPEPGLESDPHTALDVIPYGRSLMTPLQALRNALWRMARGAAVSNIKKGGRRWKVGDDHLAPTPKGVEPSWTTQYKRYWKNRAAEKGSAEKWGAEGVDRMKKGQAPQRPNPKTGDPESCELHHTPIPRRGGGKEFTDLWPDEHAAVDKYRRLKKK